MSDSIFIWLSIFWPFKWIKFAWIKLCKDLNKRYRLYLRGKRRLLSELNVVQFIKMQHDFKFLRRLLLTKQERMIAAYQRINRISETSDSQSSCSDNSITKQIPKMFDDSKVKQAHSEVVEKLLDKYLQNRHSLKDLMLMHAVCSNKELISTQL